MVYLGSFTSDLRGGSSRGSTREDRQKAVDNPNRIRVEGSPDAPATVHVTSSAGKRYLNTPPEQEVKVTSPELSRASESELQTKTDNNYLQNPTFKKPLGDYAREYFARNREERLSGKTQIRDTVRRQDDIILPAGVVKDNKGVKDLMIGADTRNPWTRNKVSVKEKLLTKSDKGLTPKEIISVPPLFVAGILNEATEFTKGFLGAGVQTVKGLTVDIDKTLQGVTDVATGRISPGEIWRGAGASAIANPSKVLGQITFDTWITLRNPVKDIAGVKTKANSLLDKNLKSRPYYAEEIARGAEVHKGTDFRQWILKYKGEKFERAGKTYGVRRVEAPNIKNPSSVWDAVSIPYIKKARKPGQIKHFDPIGEDLLLRDVPSQFATGAEELAQAGKINLLTSVTPDSKFLKGGTYTVLSGGGKELTSLSGRAGTGGAELAQFYGGRTIRDITLPDGSIIKKGTPQAYLFYAEKELTRKVSYKDLVSGDAEFSLWPRKPGVIVEQSTIKKPRVNTDKPYVELSQDLAGYTEPNTFQLSPSTIKGVRTELEFLKTPGSKSNLRQVQDINLPKGETSFNVFSAGFEKLSKSGYRQALENNIAFLEGRIKQVQNIITEQPLKSSQGLEIISREQANIRRIQNVLDNNPAVVDSPVLSSGAKSFISTELKTPTPKPVYSTVEVASDISGRTSLKSLSLVRPPTTASFTGLEVSSGSQGTVLLSSAPSQISDASRSFVPRSSGVRISSPSRIPYTPPSIVVVSSPVSSGGSSRGGSRGGSSRLIVSESLPTAYTQSSGGGSSSSSSLASSGGSSTTSRSSSIITGSSYGGSSSGSYNPPIIRYPRRSSPSNIRESFIGQVRKGGRFETVIRGSLTEVKEETTRLVESSPLASIKILSSRTGRAIENPGFLGSRYRQGKNALGVFVEKNKFRIDTGGEVAGISRKGGKKKSKKKGIFEEVIKW